MKANASIGKNALIVVAALLAPFGAASAAGSSTDCSEIPSYLCGEAFQPRVVQGPVRAANDAGKDVASACREIPSYLCAEAFYLAVPAQPPGAERPVRAGVTDADQPRGRMDLAVACGEIPAYLCGMRF